MRKDVLIKHANKSNPCVWCNEGILRMAEDLLGPAGYTVLCEAHRKEAFSTFAYKIDTEI